MNETVAVPETKGWSEAQKYAWYLGVDAQGNIRDYQADVVSRLMRLPANVHTLESYGTIHTPHEDYDALRVTVGDVRNGKPNILITGGVHGYEPSGVEAAIRFLEEDAPRLSDQFNFIVYPCISPWGYEYDQRWNWQAEDVNRNFSDSKDIVQIDECVAFMTSIKSEGAVFAAAIDLHETNERDKDLRVLRAERFGSEMPTTEQINAMPQGFHLMINQGRMEWQTELQREFAQSIVNRVSEISPIAPEQKILDIVNDGGILISPPKAGLMRHYLGAYARLVAVTEVCPAAHHEQAVQTQLAAIYGALDHVL